MIGQLDDTDLLHAFKQGNQFAFEQIYKHYYPVLMAMSLKHIKGTGCISDAKDIVSTVLTELWSLHNRKGYFASMQAVTAFLSLVLKRDCIDFLRKKKRGKVQPFDHTDSLVIINDELDMEFLQTLATEKRVLAAVQMLPMRCKQVITLYYLHGLKYREIAAQLQISHRTVENQLRYALKKLRNALTK